MTHLPDQHQQVPRPECALTDHLTPTARAALRAKAQLRQEPEWQISYDTTHPVRAEDLDRAVAELLLALGDQEDLPPQVETNVPAGKERNRP